VDIVAYSILFKQDCTKRSRCYNWFKLNPASPLLVFIFFVSSCDNELPGLVGACNDALAMVILFQHMQHKRHHCSFLFQQIPDVYSCSQRSNSNLENDFCGFIHSFETQPHHRPGPVIRSQIKWVDPGQQKKKLIYNINVMPLSLFGPKRNITLPL
jgi:hypothetical protein